MPLEAHGMPVPLHTSLGEEEGQVGDGGRQGLWVAACTT